MAEKTGIAWCDSTRNFWTGCTKIGPGCDGCYAEAKDQRFYGGAHWGPGAPRLSHLDGAARDLRRWNKRAEQEIKEGVRTRWTVFVDSQSDLFDNEVADSWRSIAFALMRECLWLTFIVVTKRIGNAKHMLPEDWGDGYPNVWLIATINNQEIADRDLPKLLSIPAALHGVSYEPALGPVDWRPYLHDSDCGLATGHEVCTCSDPRETCIDWVIVGGESDQPGHPARPFNIAWARSTVRQCRDAGIAPFVKQLGSHVIWNGCASPGEHWPLRTRKEDTGDGNWRVRLKDRAGADPSEWPEDLRVQEFPG